MTDKLWDCLSDMQGDGCCSPSTSYTVPLLAEVSTRAFATLFFDWFMGRSLSSQRELDLRNAVFDWSTRKRVTRLRIFIVVIKTAFSCNACLGVFREEFLL